MRTTDARANRLFIFLAGFFLTNALIGEFVGVKIFALEATIGAPPFHWSLFGIDGTLNFTAGVLVWPFVFIMTDVINEYFGVRGVRLISWIAVALHCLRVRRAPTRALRWRRRDSGWTSTRTWACPTSSRRTR